jgi:DNA-binding CsgD family transcriptional regulator
MMSEKIIKDLIISLNTRLDIIIKLMVLLKAQDKNQSEQIWLLSAGGLQPKEIANILGTTPNTVRVILSGLRRQKAKPKKVQKRERRIKNESANI